MEHIVTGRFRMAGILDDSLTVWLIGSTVEQSKGEAMESGTYFPDARRHRNQRPPTRETVVNVTQAEKKSDGALRLNPRSSTSSFLSRVVGACLAVLLWGVGAQAQDEVATLLNLSPWQSYVHLFCDKTGGADCAVTFRCGQQSGAPVTWPVEVEPSRIFTYWPNKTDAAGRPAGLEAALVNAGLTSPEARRRTTCTVRSDAPVKARAYTFIAGQLVPVANVNTVTAGGATSDDHGNTLERATRVRFDTNIAGVLERAGDEDYFRVEIAEAGNLTVETTGTTDTYGYLRREDDTILGQNDDGGDASNFRIVQSVTTGTYYVVVIGYDRTETGPYNLSVRFSAGEPDGDGPQPTPGHVAEAEASHCLDVRRDFSRPGSFATIRNRCNFGIHVRDACTFDGYQYSRSRGVYQFINAGLGYIAPLGSGYGVSTYSTRTLDRSCPADNYKVIACRHKNVVSYSPNFSEPDGSRYVCLE